VLLCDEPTGNLDSVSTESVLDLLDDLHGTGITLMVITHDPNVARRARLLLTMHDGRISAAADRGAAGPVGTAAATPAAPPAGSSPLKSKLRLIDLATEAWAGLLQRPGRTALTMLGTLLGIAALVTILGLTSTAAGQIGNQFSALDATEATAIYVGPAGSLGSFLDPGPRLARLHGLIQAGIWWQAPDDISPIQVATEPGVDSATAANVSVSAASPGLLEAVQARASSGTLYNSFHERTDQKVALLGSVAATALGITSVTGQPAVFLDGTGYTVIGILAANSRLPPLDLSVVIPASDALREFGPPDSSSPAEIYMRTRVGAAPLVAQQAPAALDPRDESAFTAEAAPNPTTLASGIDATVSHLLLGLAGIAIIVGAFGIANATLVAVIERTAEIGVRRALGARRWHICCQFLAESGAVGLVGGLIGAAIGVVVVVSYAILRHWTAVLPSAYAFLAPPAGAVIGLIAGAYPAFRAARIEPSAALRR
jgi:putative ABC transport system permease protein